MQLPIPSDWDGETWSCFQIQWPASQSYWALLRGFLSYGTRGRVWDANTGNIKAEQEKWWQIFDANVPFVDCNGDVVPGSDTDNKIGGGLVLVPAEWIENMITDVEFDCTTGILKFKSGLCCIKEIDLTCLQSGVIGTNDDPYDPPAVQQACGKASGMVDMLWLVLDAGWDAQGSTWPTNWVNTVQAAVPGYDLDNLSIWRLVQLSVDLDNDYSKSEVLTDYRKQQLKCLLAPALDETSVGITQTQYDAFRSLCSNVFVGEQIEWAQWGIDCFGYGNMKNIAALSAPVTADCSCPDSGDVTQPDIYFTGAYSGPLGTDFVLELFEAQYSGRRVRMRINSFGSGNKQFTDFEPAMAGGQPGDTVKIRVYPTPGAQHAGVPANVANITSATITEAQWCEIDIQDNTTGQTRTNASGYVEFETVTDATRAPVRVDHAGYKYPTTESGNVLFDYIFEIVAINGVALTPIGP